MLCGMGSCMAYARAQPGVSDYDFHGVNRLNGETMNLAVLAALSCGPAEALNAEWMEDDRLMKRLQWLEEVVQVEQDAVGMLSMKTFQVCAAFTTWTPTELRSKANRVVLITRSYLDFKVFNDARSYPWSLCIGDKVDNLIALNMINIKPSTDSVAAQLWQLLRQEWPMCLMVEVLQHLEELPWTSKATEEGHAAAAVVLKHYPEFHEDALHCRTMLYQVRVLFGTSETQTLVERLQHQANSFSFGSPLRNVGQKPVLEGCDGDGQAYGCGGF